MVQRFAQCCASNIGPCMLETLNITFTELLYT